MPLFFVCIIKKQFKKSIYIIVLLPIIFTSNFYFSKRDIHTAEVIDVYSSSVKVRENGGIFYVSTGNYEIRYADTISYGCQYDSIDSNEDESFKIFLLSIGANGYCNANDISIESHSKRLTSQKENQLLDSENKYLSDFSLIMMMGDKNNLSTSIYNEISNLGIMHLFAISGFHISILIRLIEKILNKLNLQKMNFIFIPFTFLFLCFFRLPYSALRSWTYTSIRHINKEVGIEQIEFNSYLESVSLILIFMPYLFFNSGFWISQTVSIMISIVNSKEFKKIIKVILISLFAFLVSQSIIITFSNYIYIFSPIFTLILSPLIELLFIVDLFVIWVPQLWPLFDYAFWFLYLIAHLLSYASVSIKVSEINYLSSLVLITFNFLVILVIDDILNFAIYSSIDLLLIITFMYVYN